ncbi:MAG: DUF3667 domain-containing protein [Kordiimonas sp.]
MSDTVLVHSSDREEEYYCLNCEEVLTGPYCAACGQKDIGARLNSRLMIHNLFESLTDLNSKPWRTLIELVKNPGKVALAYINGARSSYINPIRFMITTFAIYIAFLAANGWLEVNGMQNVNFGSVDETDTEKAQVLAIIERYALEIRNIVSHQRDLLTFIVVPIFSFCLRWLFFKTEKNFAETLTFTCYALGQIQLYALLVAMVPVFFPVEYRGMPDIIPFAVFWQSISGFYGRKRIKTFLMTVVSYMLFWMVNAGTALLLAALYVKFGG